MTLSVRTRRIDTENAFKIGPHIAALERALLDAGANPNTIEHGGYTPLHQAAEQGDLVLVQLLLGRGASPTPKDDQGRTPLDLAEAKGHSEATGLLRRA